ncbi:hypothetical protein C0992_007000 [Termitomyces sp. T32_za158]|nr:hypothetical protein C0992_007000 [Termitomyces sp. T32_za158]
MAFGKHGITVNAYAPGPIETPMLHYMDGENATLTQGKTGDLLGALRQKSLLGFNGSPDDIASLVSYLVSKEAGFITDRLQNTVYGPEKIDAVDSEDDSRHQSYPTDEDVFVVQAILLQFVPPELVNTILAMYSSKEHQIHHGTCRP